MPQPRDQPGRAGDADRLADDEAEDHAEPDRAGDRGGEAVQSADSNSRGEEGEHRHRHACGERPDPVLEDLCEPVGRVVLGNRAHRDAQGKEHAGNGGMDAGGVREGPGNDGERHEEQPDRPGMPADEPLAAIGDDGEQRDRHQRCDQQHRLQVAGVEEGDDRDRDQVVRDGEGQQERA